MPINFYPNDPLATDSPMRVVPPRGDRPPSRAGFKLTGAKPEAPYDLGTAGFVYWQVREAALAAVEMWEDIAGNLSSWQPGTKLNLFQDAGEDLNAFYDRSSLSFFHYAAGGHVYFSGASTDVVAHEAGHALLDAVREELFDSTLLEPNAFHEAFGDCVAILTALYDKETRRAVLPKLGQKNFVESTAEYLAAGIKKLQPGHNAAAPRRARGNYKWQLPTTLPEFDSTDDGPGVLINEAHSFGQVFSGCFYDTIVNIFETTSKTEADLLASARTAGKLLAEAVQQAPHGARFFRAVGRAMVLADEARNGGANHDAITAAFEGRNILLGAASMLAPSAALDGAAPKVGETASLGTPARHDLLARIGAAGGKLAMSAVRFGKKLVAQAVHKRLVPLAGLSKKLAGVVAPALESVFVGDSGGRAAVLGALPEATTTADEVRAFVRSLLAKGAILFDALPTGKAKVAAAVASAAATSEGVPSPITHAIKDVKGEKTLVRLRYACRCCRVAE